MKVQIGMQDEHDAWVGERPVHWYDMEWPLHAIIIIIIIIIDNNNNNNNHVVPTNASDCSVCTRSLTTPEKNMRTNSVSLSLSLSLSQLNTTRSQRTSRILPDIVPLPPPGLPRMSKKRDSSSGASWDMVDMKCRRTGRPTPGWPLTVVVNRIMNRVIFVRLMIRLGKVGRSPLGESGVCAICRCKRLCCLLSVEVSRSSSSSLLLLVMMEVKHKSTRAKKGTRHWN